MQTSIAKVLSPLVGFALLLFAAAAQANDGRIAFMVGQVTVNGIPAERGTAIKQGDEIRAGRKGTALVVMKDKTSLRVSPNSTIRIREYEFSEDRPSIGKVVVSLTRGTLRFISGLINKRRPGSSSVTTAVATMGIRGSDGVFTYTPASGDFRVQFNRGSGVMRFFDNAGNQVATVNVPTNQRTVARRGQTTVTQEAVVPDAVTQAINNAKGADGNVDEAQLQQQAADLSPVERMVLIAVAATQENEDTGNLVGAISGAVSGAGASENAAGAVFVANLLDPGNAGTHTREALENINSGSGGATSDDAREVVQASAETGRTDGQDSADTAVDMGLLSRPEAQREVREVIQENRQENRTLQNLNQQQEQQQEEEKNENPQRDQSSPN